MAITTFRDVFLYSYSLANGAEATDPIGTWALIIPPGKEPLVPPGGDPRAIWPGPEGAPVWHGGPSFVPIAKQAIFPDAPLGRYMRWTHNTGHEIEPGQNLGGFGIESKMRPGLTTAWFARGKVVDFDQSWPREIFKDLELFEDRQWRERYLVTVGPMFGPDMPEQTIVERFQTGLKRMVERRWLDGDSAFTSEAIALLRGWKETQPLRRVLRKLPATKLEGDIRIALELSLKIDIGK